MNQDLKALTEIKKRIKEIKKKVLIKVRKPFRKYDTNISDLQNISKIFNGVIYPLNFQTGRKSQNIV